MRPTRPGSKVALAATDAAAATITPASVSWPFGNTISALSGPSRWAISQSYSSQSNAQVTAIGSASASFAAVMTALSAQPVRPDKRGAVVQAAIEYLDDHLAEHITMASVAHAVHMSIRAVQQGFHEQLGITPMTYVRERRLERVHEELMDATPADGITVTAVAERWGFHHLGSFGGEYRKRWGESPSQTLRR